MSSKEKPVQGEAGAWRVRPHDTDLSAARVINDARLAESMAAHRWLVEPLTELPTPAESQPQGVEADEHRMMMDDLRLYGTAFSKNGKRIPPEDVYITQPPAPAESQPDPWTPSDADYDFNKAWRRGGLGLIELLCGANRETWRRT